MKRQGTIAETIADGEELLKRAARIEEAKKEEEKKEANGASTVATSC